MPGADARNSNPGGGLNSDFEQFRTSLPEGALDGLASEVLIEGEH